MGGGVSMLNTSARLPGRTNAYVPSSRQRAIHLSSRPSSAGFSGTPRRTGLGGRVGQQVGEVVTAGQSRYAGPGAAGSRSSESPVLIPPRGYIAGMTQVHHAAPAGRELTRLAVSATLHCLTGCAIGEVLGMVLAHLVGLVGPARASRWRSRWPSCSGTR